MAGTQYRNGPDLSPDSDRSGERGRNVAAAIAFAGENWRILTGALTAVMLGGGAAALLPVRHYEFDQFKTDIKAEIRIIKNDAATDHAALQRVEDNTYKILSKLSDRPTAKESSAVPASFPHPERPRPNKPKRPHPQRIGSLARTLGLTR